MLLDERAADAQRRARAILSDPQRSSSRARRALESKAMMLRLYAGGTPTGGTCDEVAELARRLFGELVLAGGRAPAVRDGAGELTPSERRVAALAAAGRSNREIANALYVALKAVEWHLGNAYRKLDIRGRDQLPDALRATDAGLA